MNAISESLWDLQAAGAEIRRGEDRSETSLYCCNRSLGCHCLQFSDVRAEFLMALKGATTQTASTQTDPPRPTELPPFTAFNASPKDDPR